MNKFLLFILLVFKISGLNSAGAETDQASLFILQAFWLHSSVSEMTAVKNIKQDQKLIPVRSPLSAKPSAKNTKPFPYNNSYWDNFKFSQTPILHSGRIKPLSSFAREYLLTLSERSSFKDMSADQWLIETLFDPQASLNRPLFKIRNPEIIDILNLTKNKANLYSFNELSKALDKIIDQLNKIKNKSEENRSLIEKQLLNLYLKSLSYFELSRSLFMILPIFSLESQALTKKLDLTPNKKYNWLEILKVQPKIDKEIQQMKEINFKTLSQKEQELIVLSYRINLLSKNESNTLLRIIPPQWEDNKELWLSPWFVLSKGRGSPLSADYLEKWIQMEAAYRTEKNLKAFGEAVYQKAIEISKDSLNPLSLFMEKIFNDIHFFKKSLILYLMSFLCLLFSFLLLRSFFYKLSLIALISGFFLHLTGILFRIYIMGRPPVSTLYESILFVGLVSTAFALLLEKSSLDKFKTEKGVGLLIGSLLGTTLHFLAFKYKGAESMSLLVPVLNTNFWLATHVTCISIGYACAVTTSIMGHIYILLSCFSLYCKKRNKTPLTIDSESLYKKMSYASFLALFFCLFGTILGGIWADQSWGRFWGWDPKENGALAIVIWLLVLLHGQLAGLLKKKSYALGMVFTNIIVALSWFGVNLLSVGLHSYGFTQDALAGLIAFCSGEILFILLTSVYLVVREKDLNS